MPSRRHEALVKMFQDRPEFAADLLVDHAGVTVPAFQDARLSSGDLTDIAPTEFRADAVVTLDVAGKPVYAVVIEVQLSRNQRKRYVWPAYVGTLYARLECPVLLLVVCHDQSVARWCARPIVVSDPGMVLTPVVIGPDQ